MASATTRGLLIAATVLSGLLAGGDADRELVAMPAWQQVGAVAWAEFSRHADLGNGLIWYPLEAIGGALLTVATAISYHLDRTAPRSAGWPMYTAVALVVGGLLLTLAAAPIMLGIRDVTDPVALQTAFAGFRFWGSLRAVCQVLAFVALLWAAAELLRTRPQS